MNPNLFFEKVRNRIEDKVGAITRLRDARTMKSDLSFVTEGDLMLNDIIEDLAREAGVGVVVSEEKFNDEVLDTSGYIVVVDPLDGTENFTSGLPEWGVSISCFHNGLHIGSMLGCPEMHLWLKTGDTIPAYFSRIRGLSSSLTAEEIVNVTKGHEYRMLGCCVYNMINVIRGSFLSFENPRGAHAWDILAGLNLALEHDLKVSVNDKKYSGEYLQANQKYRFRVER